ncbi:MAG: 7-carboxy-7-deazaguanine synthase QueE [Akkermansiaceae bacterium]
MKLAKLGDGPEIFHTIQGEGISVGAPAVFIRSSRCNLHCLWCDTDHTWNFEGTPWPHEKDAVPGYAKHRKAEVTFEITAEDAAERILSYHCQRTVITGGEPLLQQEDFLKLIGKIRARQPDHQFEVETNATRIPSPTFYEAVNQFNVSPKLANAGMPESLRLQPQVLAFFANSPKAWFKFVVAEPADLAEIQVLCSTHQIQRQQVILMPEGRTCEELDRNAPWLAETCRDLGFRFSDRLHIRLWGDKRGV